jgi:ubiquitin carboxyl-terminal hydrolase 7
VSVETLDGDNKYQAEGYGLQDAKKGVIFKAFPPVLHLQLRRFEYDVDKDALVKINDRHEFPLEIDLAEFLDESADRTISHVYKLHGVLVHSGDLHGGHYFALIKPEADGRWYKFDDDRVTPVTDKEVLEDNFGGDLVNGMMPTHQRTQARTLKKFTNAYMLVYIRETELGTVLAPFTENDTPRHLKERLDAEREQMEAKKREKDEQHLYLTAKIITDDLFSKHEGFDLASFDDKNMGATDLPTFRVLKDETYAKFKQRIATYFKIAERDFRLWVLVNRQNKTIRPDVPIQESDHPQSESS